MSTAPRDDLRDCDNGGAGVRTLHQLADPSRSSCSHTSSNAPASAAPRPRSCGQRADLKEYRQL